MKLLRGYLERFVFLRVLRKRLSFLAWRLFFRDSSRRIDFTPPLVIPNILLILLAAIDAVFLIFVMIFFFSAFIGVSRQIYDFLNLFLLVKYNFFYLLQEILNF